MSHPERVQGGLSPGREQHLRVQHTSQYSIMSDSSLAEDILEKLQDFPVVPGPDLHPAPSPAPPISENGHAPGGGPDALSKLGDVHSELVDVPVVVEVGTDEDDEKILVDTSRLLHSHPNLVMEHFDPATNVHTFKIAYPPRHHPELARLSQPESMTTSGSATILLSP
ncbi:hypothetical protein BV25DRAFT_401595 [Artomyces pyxidatus]|uniref:Uncharacterized protein n=1 Tax=Artomyces pyxidatus TaxID=48021 RepID=A0ACB8T470_9AGAM|nr:hypothetical protein BV25DRAFT_401595 [Artomyces pyxidatus]